MQENPLLWSQIQRSLAVLDYPEINLLPVHLPPVYSSPRQTREMAINTSNSSHSSASEQPSLHEDGVWEHSPSPKPDVQTSFAHIKITAAEPVLNNRITPTVHDEAVVATPSKNIPPTPTTPSSFLPHSNVIPEIKQQFPFQMTRFSPVSSSTPNFNHNKQEPPASPQEQIIAGQEQQSAIDYEPEEKTKSLENELVDTAGSTETLPMQNEPAAHRVKTPPVEERKVSPKASVTIKPFRLESESEEMSEAGISGPPTHNAADDDSDSFWN